METNRKNSNWQEKSTVLKGNLGEKIIDDYLISQGIIPYFPNIDSAHPFDRLCANKEGTKIFICEMKSKSRRTYYPDTGINLKHYEKYIYIQEKYKIPIFLVFIDEHLKIIYGQYLQVLIKNKTIYHNNKILDYPIRHNGIIYFPLESMRIINQIDDESSKQLKDLSNRNYDYSGL